MMFLSLATALLLVIPTFFCVMDVHTMEQPKKITLKDRIDNFEGQIAELTRKIRNLDQKSPEKTTNPQAARQKYEWEAQKQEIEKKLDPLKKKYIQRLKEEAPKEEIEKFLKEIGDKLKEADHDLELSVRQISLNLFTSKEDPTIRTTRRKLRERRHRLIDEDASVRFFAEQRGIILEGSPSFNRERERRMSQISAEYYEENKRALEQEHGVFGNNRQEKAREYEDHLSRPQSAPEEQQSVSAEPEPQPAPHQVQPEPEIQSSLVPASQAEPEPSASIETKTVPEIAPKISPEVSHEPAKAEQPQLSAAAIETEKKESEVKAESTKKEIKENNDKEKKKIINKQESKRKTLKTREKTKAEEGGYITASSVAFGTTAVIVAAAYKYQVTPQIALDKMRSAVKRIRIRVRERIYHLKNNIVA